MPPSIPSPAAESRVTLGREARSGRIDRERHRHRHDTRVAARVFDLFVQDDRSLDRARGGLGIGLTLVQEPRRASRRHGLGVEPRRRARERVRCATAGHRSGGPSHDQNAARPSRVTKARHPYGSWSSTTIATPLGPWRKSSSSTVIMSLALMTASRSSNTWLPSSPRWSCSISACRGSTAIKSPSSSGSVIVRRDLMLIAVTGYGGELTNTRAQLAGFDHFLVKPVNLSALRKSSQVVQPGRSAWPGLTISVN